MRHEDKDGHTVLFWAATRGYVYFDSTVITGHLQDLDSPA